MIRSRREVAWEPQPLELPAPAPRTPDAPSELIAPCACGACDDHDDHATDARRPTRERTVIVIELA